MTHQKLFCAILNLDAPKKGNTIRIPGPQCASFETNVQFGSKTLQKEHLHASFFLAEPACCCHHAEGQREAFKVAYYAQVVYVNY